MGNASADALPLQSGRVVEEGAAAGAPAKGKRRLAHGIILDVFQDLRPRGTIPNMGIHIDYEVFVELAL